MVQAFRDMIAQTSSIKAKLILLIGISAVFYITFLVLYIQDSNQDFLEGINNQNRFDYSTDLLPGVDQYPGDKSVNNTWSQLSNNTVQVEPEVNIGHGENQISEDATSENQQVADDSLQVNSDTNTKAENSRPREVKRLKTSPFLQYPEYNSTVTCKIDPPGYTQKEANLMYDPSKTYGRCSSGKIQFMKIHDK